MVPWKHFTVKISEDNLFVTIIGFQIYLTVSYSIHTMLFSCKIIEISMCQWRIDLFREFGLNRKKNLCPWWDFWGWDSLLYESCKVSEDSQGHQFPFWDDSL